MSFYFDYRDRFGGPPNDRWGPGEDHKPPQRLVGPPAKPGPPQHVSNEDRTNDVEIIVCDRNLT